MAFAQPTARRALREGEHRFVALRLDDGAVMGGGDFPDQLVVALDDRHPGRVTEPRQRGRRVDDVGEYDRNRAIESARGGEVGLLS